MFKIYILEDDDNIRELITYTLRQSGYKVNGFEKPSKFFKKLKNDVPDLILLDLMLPETDGLEVLATLKEKPHYKNLPVIIITAKASEYDTVIGLDSGADDYITKPFGMMELLARIKALLRRANVKVDNNYRIGKLFVDPKKHQVLVDNQKVKLTSKEYELLIILLENLEIVISRDQLLNKIWGYDFDGETRTVDVHIRSLRKKLGEAANIIQTERGFGYKAIDPGVDNV